MRLGILDWVSVNIFTKDPTYTYIEYCGDQLSILCVHNYMHGVGVMVSYEYGVVTTPFA